MQTVDLEVAIGHYPEHDWEAEAGAATDGERHCDWSELWSIFSGI